MGFFDFMTDPFTPHVGQSDPIVDYSDYDPRVIDFLSQIDRGRNYKNELAPAMLDFMDAVKMHESGNDYRLRQQLPKVENIESGRASWEVDGQVIGSAPPPPKFNVNDPSTWRDGPGSGAYQFEMKWGRSGDHGGKTALGRVKAVLASKNMDTAWVDDLLDRYRQGEDIDFSNLEDWKQDIMFIADKTEAGDISLEDIMYAYYSGGEFGGSDRERNRQYAILWGTGHKRTPGSYEKDLVRDQGYLHLRGAQDIK